MEKSGTASQVSQNEKRFFDGLSFIPGKENIVQEETKPMHERPDGPDKKEKQQEFETFARETRGRVF